MIWKTTISFFAALFLSIGINAQTSTPDLRDCKNPTGTTRWNCPSNNFTLDDVYLTLVDENGTPINTVSCQSGVLETASVYLNYTSNANSSIYQTRVFADLVIDGVAQDLNVYLGEVKPANAGTQSSKIYGPFKWECGTELRLENILIVWNPTFDNKISATNYECSSYGKSQCEFGTDTFIAAPLAVQFDYSVCRENGTTTVNYSSTTNGGKAPYTFSWDFTTNGSSDSNQANPTFTTTTTSNFTTTLTVTDTQGTISSFDVLIENPSELNVIGDVTNINCDASALGSIDIAISGGTQPFVVNWTGPNGFTSSTEDLTNLEAGSYTVTIEDTYGCTKSKTFTVSQDLKPIANAGGNREITCLNPSITLDGSGSSNNPNANLTYSWSGPDSYTASTEDAIVTVAGSYTLTVTDSNNGCSSSDTIIVSQDKNAPTATITGNEELTCTNTETTLDASGSTVQGTASYSWNTNTADGAQVGTSATLNVSAPGTYYVTVTDSDNGCSASTFVEVTQDITAVVADITGNEELTCTNTEITLDASGSTFQGPASYSWNTASANGAQVGTSSTLKVSAPGTYYVTVTDNDNGCSASTFVEVTQDITAVVADITGNEELTCANTEITLDASGSTFQGSASYSWNSGSAAGNQLGTSATLKVSTPGTYYVTVTDGDNGCSDTTSVQVTQDITPVTANITGNEELTCSNTSITLDASSSNVQANASYLWNNGATTSSIEVTAPGNYSVTVTDSDNGCSDTDSVQVTQDITEVTAVISGNEELTCANTSVKLDASSSNVQANASYLWNTGATTSSIEVTAPGNYSVTVTDGDNGCSDTASVEVTQDINAVSADINGNEELTCATTEITLDASGSSVQGTATYLWSNGATTSTIKVTEPGNYSVTVTDSDNGCSAETSVNVTQDITPVIAAITGNKELTCATTEITLDASTSTVQANASYLWNNGATTATIKVTEPGNYSVTVTDSDNGCFAETSVNVTQDITPVIADITGNEELTCATTEITLDASASTVQANASYLWNNGATTATITVTEPGNYSVTVTDSDNGCSDTASVEVTQDINAVSASITGNEELTCANTSITLDASSSNVQANASYLWNTGATTSSIEVTAPGNYSVTVTDGDNGCSDTASVEVTQDINAVSANISGNEELTCATTEVTLDASGSTVQGTASYAWNTGATTATITVTEPGDYSVTVTDSDNGCSAETSVNVTQDITPVVADITGNEELTCATSEITLDASGSTVQATASYEWNTGATTATITVTEPGDYTVTVTDSDNGCSAETTVTVTQDITPVVADITGNEELTCSTTEITLDASASTVQATASYSWTKDGDATVIGTNETLTVSETGMYYVTVTDSDNGCSDTASVEVTQDANLPVATITGNEELTCTTTEITLDASASTVQQTATYSWSRDTADGTVIGSEATLLVSEPGTYFVTVTDVENGCSTTDSVNVTQDITPVTTDITGNEELTCATTEVTLDASGSTVQGTASYEWNTGATTATIKVTEPGDYSVTVTDSDNGCSAETTVTVTQDITPVVADITGNEELTCATSEITLDASGSTVQATASYEWNTGATTATITVTEPGDYTVTVTDSDNGCSAEITVTVTQDITPVVADIIGNEELTCSTTEITLDASASTVQATASYAWIKDGDATVIGTNETLTVTETGMYYVTVTDSDNGCSDTASVEVTQDANLPVATITGNEELTCTTTEITLDASGSTVQQTATYSWSRDTADGSVIGSEATLLVSEPGTYFVTVTDAENGCSTTDSVNVTQDITPVTADITGNEELTCATTEVTLDASGSTVQGTASYEWNTGATTATITVTETGDYSVTVTDSDNGCSAEATVTVTQDITPVVADITGNETLNCTTTSITLDASGSTVQADASYLWSTGATTSSIEVTEPGDYSVTVTDSDNGCFAEATVSVEQNTITSEAIITGNEDLDCNNTSVTLDASTSTIQGTATYLWSTGATSASIEVTEAGDYSVTVTDSANGCSDETSVTINFIEDTEPPVITECAAVINTIADEGVCTASEVELGTLTATDNCPAELNITNDAPEVFPLGETTVTWTVTDAAGNSTTCEQIVNVIDTQAPVITACASNMMTVEADNGVCEASQVNLGMPTVSDNCTATADLTITNDAPEVFPLGETTVTWTITDAAGNSTTCEQIVNVIDTQEPVITVCASDMMTVEADNGVCEASQVDLGMPTVSDNCTATADLTITNDAPTVFALGETTVTWTITDAAGNSTTCEQIVNVIDTQAPIITACASDMMTVEADNGVCEASQVDLGMPTVSDNCTATADLTITNDAPTVFALGETTVTWTITDAAGNSTTCEQIVNVIDTQAPVITACAADIMTVEADNGVCEASQVDLGMPTVSDNCTATEDLTITNDAPSVFTLGETTVTWTITDAAGNSTTCEQIVNVIDTQAPVITACASDMMTVEADNGVCEASQVDLGMPVVSDNCTATADLTITNDAPTVFALGETTVTWTITDAAGNSTTCEQIVNVIDTQAPVFETVADINQNNDTGICGAVVNYDIPVATDNCGIESTTLTSGIASGEEFPIGTTTITYTATDGSGNTSTVSFDVTITDNEAPTIECPESFTVNVEFGTTSTIVTYNEVIASDNCGETTVTMTSGIASGGEFPVGDTVIEYTVVDANGNEATCEFTITVEEDPAPAPPAAPEPRIVAPTCENPFGSITITTENGVSFTIDGENFQDSGVFENIEPGTYQISVKDEFGQESEVITVVIEEPVAEEIEVTQAPDLYNDGNTPAFDLFDLLVGDVDESGTWIDNDNTGALDNGFIDPSIMEAGTYIFTYELDGFCPSSTQVSVTILEAIVLDCSVEDIKDGISKAVTPNGDNRNDFFEVNLDTECGFTYDLRIFNRWGAEVYTAQNYQNDWDGYSKSSFTSSNQLPSGTYYYILEIRNSEFQPIQGYIYLGTK
ncbi:gliding motility-associated-like protein [Christiangramia gaetbulicola]|uniref:Gliding motility-associated-like protein n=1 Tax=Christiangramia gaetbulicola TaxID=703340 RepID=A0A2T6AGB3_9FLAO|nr:HYR domain-containing protein [Christiangramia gaetbulicola]PTX42878.1 gliding motility-associated-like protein [Christiangramia gaetbulicola]